MRAPPPHYKAKLLFLQVWGMYGDRTRTLGPSKFINKITKKKEKKK